MECEIDCNKRVNLICKNMYLQKGEPCLEKGEIYLQKGKIEVQLLQYLHLNINL